MREYILETEKLRMGVIPELGGCLSFLQYRKDGRDTDLLRTTDPNTTDPNQSALFPMVPYCGRIRGGAFTYWGILRKVPKTHGGFADPIHGDGWVNSWEVVSQTPTAITMRLSHDKKDGGFPFTYTAELTYTIAGDSLNIRLSVHNPAALPMPCGLGIHPFFLRTKDVMLDYRSRVVWSNETDPIFDEPYSTPAAWNFDGGKPLNNAVFDTCFGGFEERAQIIYPEKDITVEITTNDLFHHVTLYAPKGKNFFCLEPCSNASNAFNLAADGVIGTGIRSIGPGQDLVGEVNFRIKG